MDTRKKIVEPGEIALSGLQQTLIIGYFDPVYAAHAARLAELHHEGEELIVAIADPPHPLLPWQARAELLAGFAQVSYVIHLDHAAELTPARILDHRSLDEDAKQQLIEHILSKHRSA